MATVRIEIIKGRDEKFHTHTRVDPRPDDTDRIGERICVFEAEIEDAGLDHNGYKLEMYRKIAIACGMLFNSGLTAVEEALPELKIRVPY